ncbi:hypothetical protein MYXO_00962 [Myxococcaceae bacterium]|jgi:hypothetical protein|nr:hypothetical protein MYXO_00962 [Myxococcaceae bacterium]
MAIGIVLEETMSGWIELDGEPTRSPFSFTIRAFTRKFWKLSAPRPFRGVVRVAGREVPTRGILTIHLSGPRYELDFEHPTRGPVHAEGEKTYTANPKRLAASLVTCPLVVFAGGRRIGAAEVAYREPMWSFAFRAVRLVREENAFGTFGAACREPSRQSPDGRFFDSPSAPPESSGMPIPESGERSPERP